MAAMTMTRVTGGVDTHLDVHVAAALDEIGGLLATASFRADAAGYRQLLGWLRGFGEVVKVGVEGTGSYGAGLSRRLHAEGVFVVEVDRPNRRKRRRSGKTDTLDAINAARAALSGEAAGAAKTRTGNVESIRVLRVARGSARVARTQALNQMRSLVCTAPEDLRERLRDLSIVALVQVCAGLRPGTDADVSAATKLALRTLGRRVLELESEIDLVDATLRPLVTATAPALVAAYGVGPDTAGALLVAAGDNPDRLRSEACFARLCGVAPIEASSGKVTRHRLHRGGDRQANSALWRIVITRMSNHPETRTYVERRDTEGRSKKEIIRCLKRYTARELFSLLPHETLA
jgi:transposase